MIEINVSKEMYAEWRENPVTKAFFRGCFERREGIKEMIAQGRYPSEVQNAIARCQELESVLNTEFKGDEDA